MISPRFSDEKELVARIEEIRKEQGNNLVILGHHYQRREIVELSDYRGDSFELSRKAAAQKEAKYIVFCGVKFMAESAAVLAGQEQIVQLPEMTAGCPMADMAETDDVELAWEQLTDICGDEIVPITYMNSSAAVKAFCGKHGGAVCTSSNAEKLFRWGYSRKKRLFFLPDEHLGTNTANKMGIPRDQRVVWDFNDPELGGNSEDRIRRATLILWKGFCHVHKWFTLDHVADARRRFPEGKIVVHPECVEQVVDAADFDGSTAFIVKFVEEASPGETIIIGTEINLIHRLAQENPDKRVVELARSLCPNMYRINLLNLLDTLEHLGERNVITVPDDVKEYAAVALNTMLDVVG